MTKPYVTFEQARKAIGLFADSADKAPPNVRDALHTLRDYIALPGVRIGDLLTSVEEIDALYELPDYGMAKSELAKIDAEAEREDEEMEDVWAKALPPEDNLRRRLAMEVTTLAQLLDESQPNTLVRHQAGVVAWMAAHLSTEEP